MKPDKRISKSMIFAIITNFQLGISHLTEQGLTTYFGYAEMGQPLFVVFFSHPIPEIPASPAVSGIILQSFLFKSISRWLFQNPVLSNLRSSVALVISIATGRPCGQNVISGRSMSCFTTHAICSGA